MKLHFFEVKLHGVCPNLKVSPLLKIMSIFETSQRISSGENKSISLILIHARYTTWTLGLRRFVIWSGFIDLIGIPSIIREFFYFFLWIWNFFGFQYMIWGREGLQFYVKGTPSEMLSSRIWEVYRKLFSYLQMTVGRMLLTSSNILNVSLSFSAINQFNYSLRPGTSRSSCSQRFTLFALKMFIVYYQKITRVKCNTLWLRST